MTVSLGCLEVLEAVVVVLCHSKRVGRGRSQRVLGSCVLKAKCCPGRLVPTGQFLPSVFLLDRTLPQTLVAMVGC